MRIAEGRTSYDVAVATWSDLVAPGLMIAPVLGIRVPWWGYAVFSALIYSQLVRLVWKDNRPK